MPSGCRIIPVLFLLSTLTGCAANDLMVKRQTEAETRIEFLLQSVKKGEQRLNELAAQLQGRDEQTRLTNQQIKQLQDTIRELRSTQDELKGRLMLLSRQEATPRVEVVNPASPVKAARETGPPAEYLKAFGMYSANNFTEAIAAFSAFLSTHPQSDYAPNALYWIGECHYTLSDLPKAKEAFARVSGAYPASSKAPDALLKLGYTLSALKEKDQAHAVFERLITAYPGSSAAAKARERLGAN